MIATSRNKSSRLQLSGRDITEACLAVCGLLIIIWGGTLESVGITDPGFTSFAVSGLVIVAAGACLMTVLPRAARVALIWLATLTSMFYLFILDMAVIVSLMGYAVIVGVAAWLTIRILRQGKATNSVR